jgi:hypothetical protein
MRALLLLMFIFCSFVSVVGQKLQPEAYDVAEAYEVYSAILPTRWPVTVAHARRLVIRAETGSGYDMCLKPEGESIALLGPAIAHYLEVNKKTRSLQKVFQIETPYDLIFSEDLKGIFSAGIGGWKNFYDRYPDSGGWNELSAVGFNADRTVAVVYVAHHCGLCGEGSFHVLEKREGKWQPLKWKGSSCGWES